MRAVDCRSAIFRRGIALLENARARLRSYPPLRKERARVGHPLWWFCKGGASPPRRRMPLGYDFGAERCQSERAAPRDKVSDSRSVGWTVGSRAADQSAGRTLKD